MKAIDARTATWDEIRSTLTGRRLAAYEAFQLCGPGTTREVAERSGHDILSLRPRATELLQLGFLVCEEVIDGQGIYRALTEAAALKAYEDRRKTGGPAQLPLKLNA